MSKAKSLRRASSAVGSAHQQQPEKGCEPDMPKQRYLELLGALHDRQWAAARVLIGDWPTVLRRREAAWGQTLLETYAVPADIAAFRFLLGAGAAWRGAGGAAGTLPAMLLRYHNLTGLQALVEHAGPSVLDTGIPSRGNLMHIAIEEGAAHCFGYLLANAPHLIDERIRADTDNPRRKRTPPEFLEQWLSDAGSYSSDDRIPGVHQIRDMIAAWQSARAARSVLDELRAQGPTP